MFSTVETPGSMDDRVPSPRVPRLVSSDVHEDDFEDPSKRWDHRGILVDPTRSFMPTVRRGHYKYMNLSPPPPVVVCVKNFEGSLKRYVGPSCSYLPTTYVLLDG